MSDFTNRVANGRVAPWIDADTELEGARRSADIARDELATLARDDPRRETVLDTVAAWESRVERLEAEAER